MNESRLGTLPPAPAHATQPHTPHPVVLEPEPIELVEIEELAPANHAPAAHPAPTAALGGAAPSAPAGHGPSTIQPSSKIRQQVLMGAIGTQRASYKRTPACTGQGACRVRT